MFKILSVAVAVVMLLSLSPVIAVSGVSSRSYIQDVFTAGPPLTQGFPPHQSVFSTTDTVYMYVAYTVVPQGGTEQVVFLVTNVVGQVVAYSVVPLTLGAGAYVSNQNLPQVPAGTYSFSAILIAADGIALSTHSFWFAVGQ